MCFAYSAKLHTLFVIGTAQQAAKLNISSLEWSSLENLWYVVNYIVFAQKNLTYLVGNDFLEISNVHFQLQAH